ncbi:MAG TPA: aminotransferase class I/II-fold pyridoxal phosphate-dependent enzyme [Phycisphaerae bacterium]|nr:aminotransferase class I/II-fold pyridoxal phosphate-dependent enzyme [Phycisphaerae bacterium]
MEVTPAERLNKLPPYLFADLRRKMAAARERGIRVLRIDIGDPDSPTPDPVVAELVRAVQDRSDPNRHRYGCDVPVEAFPRAVRDFYRRRWGVELRGDQVATTMGSKDAIVKLALSILNPGDLAIAPVPGYPTYNIGHVFAGAVTYHVPLRKENAFLVDFDAVPTEARRQAKLLWISYPNNPTTAIAPMEFFERAVEFGRQNDILIAHDSAYSENTYDGYRAPSILQVDGAEEVAVEFFSLSKAFSMTGWRAGAVVGNPSAVGGLKTVKENIDNGSLRAIQFAAAKALDLAEQLIPPINAVYQRRRDLVVDALNAHGWSLERPQATIYVWAPVPEKYDGSSGAFVTDLLEKTGVMVTPGRGYGQWGEGFFRISLTYPDEVLAEAMDRIVEMKL